MRDLTHRSQINPFLNVNLNAEGKTALRARYLQDILQIYRFYLANIARSPGGLPRLMTHLWPVRVYYEDTDLAGIVYYANYLKFIERGRSEMVREAGVDQTAMKAAGVVFAVRKVTADYLKPARFEDELTVETSLKSLTGVRFSMGQRVLRGAGVLFTAEVEVVCLDAAGKPLRIPDDIRQKIAGLAGP